MLLLDILVMIFVVIQSLTDEPSRYLWCSCGLKALKPLQVNQLWYEAFCVL